MSTVPSRPRQRPGPARIVLGIEPFDSAASQWVVAQAEVELVERYGFLAEEESGLATGEFSPPDGAFMVARASADGVPIGGVGLRRSSARTGEIKRLWVHEDRRGGGIARALMEGIEVVARQFGYTSLRLETGSRQPEAMALYDSSGWLRRDEGWGTTPMRPGSVRFRKDLGNVNRDEEPPDAPHRRPTASSP